MTNLQLVKADDRLNFIRYLTMADDEQAIHTYLYKGMLYAIVNENTTIGGLMLTNDDPSTLEIKNIAIEEIYRGYGYGRQVIDLVVDFAAESSYKRIIVGTANSSIGNLLFYQKCGFRFFDIKQNYFKDYDPQVFENGIRGLDMVVFEMILKD